MSTPTLRPWRESEVPVGAVIASKLWPKDRIMITGVTSSEIHLGDGRHTTAQLLLVNFTREDGSPCGTTEP